ncbi:MAG: FHA domain-containing protein [Myxococcota bacterium]
MQVRAVVRAPGGAIVELSPGALIGRMPRCELCIDDGRVSEAHALVSLRGEALVLLPLRGRFAIDGRTPSQLELAPGQRLELAPGLELEVLEVVLPDEVLAVTLPGLPPQVLLGTTSVVLAPTPAFRSGWLAGADAWLWRHELGWRVQTPGTAPRPLAGGETVLLAGDTPLRATSQPLSSATADPTRLDGAVDAPLHLVARYQSVRISRGGRELLVLDGTPAQCVSELVAFKGPVAWEVAARELWKGDVSETLLRGRWDAMLLRLRNRLRQAGVRADLVRSDRSGFVELALRPGDVVVDEV